MIERGRMSQSGSNKDDLSKGLSRRDFLQTAGLATLAMGSGALSLTPKTAQAGQSGSKRTRSEGPVTPKRYNVLFILTDQERYMPELMGKGHWPGRDRLARLGTTFENYQVCSMVCTPSRSVIYTGQHIQHTQMFDNTNFPWIEDLPFDIPTIGDMVGDPLGGYHTDPFVTATAQGWLRRKGKPLNDEGQPWFMALNLVNPHDVMFYDTDEPGKKETRRSQAVDGH